MLKSKFSFRFGHSVLSDNLKGDGVDIPLKGHFFNSKIVTEDGKNPSDILKGECSLQAEFVDSFVIDTVRNHLFTNDEVTVGNDLFALNILVKKQKD